MHHKAEWRDNCGQLAEQIRGSQKRRCVLNKLLLHDADRSADEFRDVAESFSAREDAILLIRQLNRLIKAVQRHRGISIGLLAGNKGYQKEFQRLQTQLERRLATLEVFASANDLLSVQEKQNLANAWVTIRSDWEGDRVNDNFELHSHLIQQLLSMIDTLALNLKRPFLRTLERGSGEADLIEERNKSEVLDFTCSALPRLIEDVARIRGATSYMVAVGDAHELDEAKIRFWIGSVRGYCQAVSEQAAQLDIFGDSSPFKRISMKQTELMLTKVLDVVDSVAFLGHASLAGSTNIFDLATDVIERYWAAVNRGLDILQHGHIESLDAWLDAP